MGKGMFPLVWKKYKSIWRLWRKMDLSTPTGHTTAKQGSQTRRKEGGKGKYFLAFGCEGRRGNKVFFPLRCGIGGGGRRRLPPRRRAVRRSPFLLVRIRTHSLRPYSLFHVRAFRPTDRPTWAERCVVNVCAVLIVLSVDRWLSGQKYSVQHIPLIDVSW